MRGHVSDGMRSETIRDGDINGMAGKYTVTEVEERTKVAASTLRQWERRYGFPLPERSGAGYRLYSDRDLEHILAMKRYIDDGVPASRAAELVQKVPVTVQAPRPVEQLTHELVEALENLHEGRAEALLSEAFALHPVETVLLDVVRPAMIIIGNDWHDGAIRATTEHFASNYIKTRLYSLLSLVGLRRSSRRVIVACAPGEQHEIGPLILAVLLRRAGYHTVFLGADTPVEDLIDLVQTFKPDALLISALLPQALERLCDMGEALRQDGGLLVLGGQAFEDRPELARSLGGQFLGNDVRQVIEQLDALLEKGEA